MEGSSDMHNLTAHYWEKLTTLFDNLVGVTVIDDDMYKSIISGLPVDLAAKLRMMPDSSLSSKLAHLYAIYTTVREELPIGDVTNYSLVSIEGSCDTIPVDCDLVVWDNNAHRQVLVDFTSSRNRALLKKKQIILDQNIELNQFKNAIGVVQQYSPVSININIKPVFSSSEPGTKGLQLLDHLCTLPESVRDHFIDNCKEVYRRVILEIAHMDNSCPPGDYKETVITDGIVDESLKLVGTQDDSRSLKFLRDCKDCNEEYFPYYEGIRVLAKNAKDMKALFPIEAAKVKETRILTEKLAGLTDDFLAKALHAATLTEAVVIIDEADNVIMAKEFPACTADSIMVEPNNYKVAVQRKKGHVFTIKFSKTYADEKLMRVLTKSKSSKDKRFFKKDTKVTDKDVETLITEAASRYSADVSYFSSPTLSNPKDDIWKKILTLSALSSNDMEDFGRSTHSFLDGFVSVIRTTYAGASMSHYYEVCKSVLASLKTSPSDNSYYVGTNGSYDSVTVVKMSSTLDSFSRCAYSVIYKPEKTPNKKHTRFTSQLSGNVARTSFYSTDPNQLSYGMKMPYTWVSLATWELENNMDSGSVAPGVMSQVMIDSVFATLVNRDQFAQCSEQIRYFYMSSIGYGGSSAEIVDKTTFMSVRHHWEILYMMRSYKLAAALSTLSTKSMLGQIESKDSRELEVAFPHTNFPSRSFSQTISSMYYCNIYNKFRAFHEISEAICFNEVIAEKKIYEARISADYNAVSGLSPSFFSTYKGTTNSVIEYVYDSDFVKNEVEFSVSLAMLKSQRYSGSACFMIGSSAANVTIPSSTIDSIYERLNKAPIEACTMKGSMDDGPSTVSHQGVRAATAVFEAMVKKMGHDPKIVNKSTLSAVYMMDTITAKKPTFTILSCVIDQFNDGTVVYRYRIVQKDQKGHREISVLNFHFRVGALFVETISECLTSQVGHINIAKNPNKDKIIEDMFENSYKKETTSRGTYCYDNSDQKRWGPNHNVNFFSYFMFSMLRSDVGLMRLVLRVFDLTFAKRAKFPESLIDLITKKNVTMSRSVPIDTFIKYALPKIQHTIFDDMVSQGMCQGIYQETSSVAHVIKVESQKAVINEIYPNVKVEHLVTSDDAEAGEFIPYGTDRIKVIKFSHCAGLRIGNLTNIVRSNPKSAKNFLIGELNSIFFKRGVMATPSLKQRIAKIDVGMGVNHIEDYLSALANAASYLANGGSYMGSVIVTILNLVLHTEQWSRWEFVKSDNFYKPVEFGGFPVVEPITTILSGGISNMYQRVSEVVDPASYSRLVVASLLCPPESLSLEDFSRTGSESVKKSLAAKDLTIFKGTGPMGIFQMVKTDRKLSQFERRHGISKWPIPDSFVTLRRDSPKVSGFLFSLFRSTSVSTLETNLGVNSFFVRMAEPWASYTRPCMRLSKFSPFAKYFKDSPDVMSHKEFNEKILSIGIHESLHIMNTLARSVEAKREFEIMEAQLAVRMRDAKAIRSFFRSQEAGSFKKSYVKPSIQRVVLRGHTAADSDSYYLAIIKTLAGKKSEGLINNYRRLMTAYESIEVPEPNKPVEVVTAVIMADNAIALYNKFIRKDTKMILPNKVDDLTSLCKDIITNKFAERLGMVLEGSITLDEERAKPYAYSKWYQDLIRISAQYETSVTNSILSGGSPNKALVGVTSSRAVITRSDMFELTNTTTSERTVLLDCKSKDSFITSLRTWVGAKVNLIMNRDTISALIEGKLTYAHDYYVGNGQYFRYAKNKYCTIRAGSAKGMHIIRTTIKTIKNRRRAVYRHVFLFPEDVTGRNVTMELTDPNTDEQWLLRIKSDIESKRAPRPGQFVEVKAPALPTFGDFRKHEIETDIYSFEKLTPGIEMKVTTDSDSLCMFIETKSFKLPVTYLNPDRIDAFKIGYTLKHEDLKVAVRAFIKMSTITGNFDKTRIRMWPELNDAIDFILVNSTVDTPEFLINKILHTFIGFSLTAIQLDILRTFFIKSPKFGVGYSSSRFTQYLLNLGNRRNHFHNFLCKTAMGTRADLDSEDWDQISAEEDIITTGRTDEVLVADYEEEELNEIPNYLQNIRSEELVPIIESEAGYESSVENWAEEVAVSIRSSCVKFDVDPQTVEHVNLFSDSDDSEGEDDANGVVNDSQEGSELQDVSSSGDAARLDLGGVNSLFSGLNFDDIFDPDDCSDTGTSEDNKMDTLNDLFMRAISGTYEKIVDVKDDKLRSEKSGHTVNPNIESPRVIISFLKEWVERVGAGVDVNEENNLTKNVASVTGMYLLMERSGVLDLVNPLEKFFGLDNMVLPVELSALAVVDAIYG
jgi:hypothetical protein